MKAVTKIWNNREKIFNLRNVEIKINFVIDNVFFKL